MAPSKARTVGEKDEYEWKENIVNGGMREMKDDSLSKLLEGK